MRNAAWDAAMGGALAVLLLIVLTFTDNALRRLALQGAAPLHAIATLCLAVVAQFAVGAVLSGFVLRLIAVAD